jgi:4-amino-4-deoxy-L-arabinose transferase-like glycosyltransferase
MKNTVTQKIDSSLNGPTSLPPGIKKYLPRIPFALKIKPATALIILMVAGLALRLFFLRYRFTVAYDEVNYAKLGVSGYLNGLADILHTYWSPLLPALIAFFCNFFSDYELAGRMVSILASVLLMIPVYFLGKTVYDQTVGLIAAAFIAIFPPLAFQSTLILTETLSMLFGAVAVLFGLLMLKRYSIAFALLAGASAGLAYLSHPQGLGFIIVLAVWIPFATITKLFLIRPLRMVYLLAALSIGFIAVASPYLIYLKKTTGMWTFSAKGAANQQMATPLKGEGSSFRDLDPTNTSVPIDQVFHQGNFLQATDGGKKPVRSVQLGTFVVKYIKNFADMLQTAIPSTLTTIPMLLFAIGLLGTTWRPQQGKMVLYLLSFVVFFWLVLIPSFHIHLRYLTPLWPICALWIGKGVQTIYGWLSTYQPNLKFAARRNVHPNLLAMLFLMVAFLGLSFLPEFGRVISRKADSPDYYADAVEQKKAGLWLKANAKAMPVIMSRNHVVDFYAGNYDITQSITIPTNSFERVLAYAKHRGVKYLVLNERYLRDYPQLRFLLENPAVAQAHNLQAIYQAAEPTGLKTIIYQLH